MVRVVAHRKALGSDCVPDHVSDQREHRRVGVDARKRTHWVAVDSCFRQHLVGCGIYRHWSWNHDRIPAFAVFDVSAVVVLVVAVADTIGLNTGN